jgi:hypothetical protein
MSTLKDVISEAIFGWGLRNDDGHNLSMDDTDEIAEYIVTRTPQPVVPEVVFDILKAAQGSCRLGLNDIADRQIQIAIKTLLSVGKGGE